MSNEVFTAFEKMNEIRDCIQRMQVESEELRQLMDVVMKDCMPTWKKIDEELDSLCMYVEDLMDNMDEEA